MWILENVAVSIGILLFGGTLGAIVYSDVFRPRSEIEEWKNKYKSMEKLYDLARERELLCLTMYQQLSLAMRGAHKGIWRLKQKLKKYEKE